MIKKKNMISPWITRASSKIIMIHMKFIMNYSKLLVCLWISWWLSRSQPVHRFFRRSSLRRSWQRLRPDAYHQALARLRRKALALALGLVVLRPQPIGVFLKYLGIFYDFLCPSAQIHVSMGFSMIFYCKPIIWGVPPFMETTWNYHFLVEKIW